MFSETLNVDYVSAAWREFEMSLGPLAREAVESVCDRLTTDKVPAEENLENGKDGTNTTDLSTGTRDVAQCASVVFNYLDLLTCRIKSPTTLFLETSDSDLKH